jgi:putative redox protein
MYQNTENGLVTKIERQITFADTITDDKKERLFMIVKKCPVSKILENNITINTEIK